MSKLFLLVLAAALSCVAQASWYWPFGSDEGDEDKRVPRLSELMEGASTNIDAEEILSLMHSVG